MAACVTLHSQRLVVLQGPDIGPDARHLNTAALAATHETGQHDHLSTCVDELLWLEANVVSVIGEALHVMSDGAESAR
jgi:hypothetical protein